jgi:hypothetical protein
LVILNGKGLGSRANPDGPVPTKRAQPQSPGGPAVAPGFVAHIQTGTVAFLPAPDEEQLAAFSETVMRDSPYRDEMIYGPIDDEQVAYFSRLENHESPIQHVIYMIKENRTYDQVLGDLDKGNGDKSLNLFGEEITPNLHRLAREFILYDNFYENADVSADGHNWASAAIAPEDVRFRRRGAGEYSACGLHLGQRAAGRHYCSRLRRVGGKHSAERCEGAAADSGSAGSSPVPVYGYELQEL